MVKIVRLALYFSFLAAVAPRVVANAMPPSSSSTVQGNPGEGTGSAALAKKVAARWKTAQLPLSFEANQGQTDSAVKFISRGDGYALYLTPEGAVFTLRNGVTSEPSVLHMELLGASRATQISGAEKFTGTVNYFIGNDARKWHSGIPIFGKVNYRGIYPGVDAVFYGNQRELEYDFTVAPGVDPKRIVMEFSGARPNITRDGDIVLKLKGDSIKLHKPIIYQGEGLTRHPVDGGYAVAGNRVSFHIDAYDRSQPLVIDPVISYLTYLGGRTGTNGGANVAVTSISCRPNACPPGFSDQEGQGIAVDSGGSVYVTGQTWAVDFPTQNPFQATNRTLTNQWTAYVTKLNPTGTGLVYSTYLGGTVNEEADAIAIDASGSAYVVGTTWSGDFPTTPGSYLSQCPVQAPGPPVLTYCQSGSGAFLTKLSPNGQSLVYSTYLVAEAWGVLIRAVAVDSQGRAYVAGDTSAWCSNSNPGSCFPTTANALMPSSLVNQSVNPHTYQPGMAFLTVFSANGSSLVYSTLFGDSNPSAHGNYGNQTLNWTRASGVAVDPAGNFYLAGFTADPNIPATANAFQTTYIAFTTADRSYVAKFSPVTSANGPHLVYCTYLGAMNTNLNASDEIHGIVADAKGSAIVTGLTQNPGFPTTPGTYNPGPCGALNGGYCAHGAFVTKFTPDGTGLAWSTLLSYADSAYNGIHAILPPRLDNLGNVYVEVQSSRGYPEVNPVQTFTDTNGKLGITKLDPTGSRALFSTLLGGTTGLTQYGASNQYPAGLDVDPAGNIYIAGMTSGGDLPTTPGAFQTTFPLTSLNYTGFIAKIHPLNASPIQVPVSAGGVAEVSTANSGSSTQTGYAVAAVNPVDTPYGTAVFSFKENGVTVSEAGVPASPPTASAQIFIDYRSAVNAVPGHSGAGTIDINTGIAVLNYANAAANVTYTLRDLSGAILTVGHGIIDAGNHFACFIDQLKNSAAPDFNLPANFRNTTQFGTLEIDSDQPLSVLALRGTNNQRNDFLITTTSVADLTQTLSYAPLYFPQFADGGGYTTSLVLLNTSNGTETGTLQILDKYGSPLVVNQVGGTTNSSFSYSIPSGGALHFQTDGSPSGINVGWARLIPDASNPTPVGSGVFSYNPGPMLISESGIPSAVATTHARVYVDLSRGHNTGLAIANVGNSAASITINAFQNDGVTPAGTSSGPLQLVAYGHDAEFADQFISGLPGGFTGVLDISSTTPFAALTIRSLVNERDDFLMTTFPIADMNQAAPAPIVFPQVATGGGYVTEFIFISAGQSASTTLYYYDDTGTPTDY